MHDMLTNKAQGRNTMLPTFDQRKQIQNQVFSMVTNRLNEAPFRHGAAGGPYTTRDLSRLKALDEAVQSLGDIDIDGRRVDVTLDLHDCALAALPANTAAVLESSQGSSGFALELVRRNLTELDAMARALYASTEEQRRADSGLRELYSKLSPIVELRGALLNAGIDASKRDWAAVLTDNIQNLRRLRSTPWHEIAFLMKLIVIVDDDGGEDQNEVNLATIDGSPVWKNPPSRAEVRIIEELYAVGDGAPAIRRQVLGARLGLDVADQLEEMGIYDASSMTLQDTRELLKLASEQLAEEEKEAVAPAVKATVATADDVGQTSRALPAIAAVLSKAAPVILKSAPKLAKLTKLTKLGGKSGVGKMGNKLNAMVSNGGGGGGGGGGATGALGQASGAIDAGNQVLSGLVTGIETVGKINKLLTPDVEAAVADIQLEQARAQARIDSARQDLESVSVEGTNEEALATVRTALDKAIAAVAAPEGFLDPIAAGTTQALQSSLQDQRLTLGEDNLGTGSYSSNEELVAKASGGAALYGMNFFPTTTDIVNKPYTPILAPPAYVEMTGAVSDFTASVWQTTSMSKASAFHSISENAGTSVANKVATSEGSSRSNATWFTGKTKGSGSATSDQSTETSEEEISLQQANSSKTSSATVIEYIRCPMKSFRIPMTRMVLSEDAVATAIEVNSIRDADEFLDAFGSHVSNGRQELGGIFYSTLTMTSSETTKSSTLLSAASEQSSKLSQSAENTQSGGKTGFLGFGSKKATSFGTATSVGSVASVTTAAADGTVEQSVSARYTQYIRCAGPRAPTPETFADALFSDNSSWAVTDRGGIEALVPVTRVLENAIELLDDDDPTRLSLQSSVNFITAAWRIRAKRWGDVLLDEENANNARVPTAILDLLRTAYPIAQGVVQDLVDSVYNVLQFKKEATDYETWDNVSSYVDWVADPGQTNVVAPKKGPSAMDIGEAVARSLRKAADTATTGSSGADALLHYMDADDVGAYVELEMKRKDKNNKAVYLESKGSLTIDADDEEAKAELALWESNWPKMNPLQRLGRNYPDSTPQDKAYWNSLKPWEQRWITKDDILYNDQVDKGQVNKENRWTPEDYEVFQREFFRAPNPARFLPELEKDLGLHLVIKKNQGINVRVASADNGVEGAKDAGEINALREAVTAAALAMTNEDWVIFRKIWLDTTNPEETNRLVEIVEDHSRRMCEIFEVKQTLKEAAAKLRNARSANEVASKDSAAYVAEKKELDEQQRELSERKDELDAELADDKSAIAGLEGKREQSLSRISDAENEMEKLMDKIRVTKFNPEILKKQIPVRQAAIDEAMAELASVEADLSERQSQLEQKVTSQAAARATLTKDEEGFAEKLRIYESEGLEYANALTLTGEDMETARKVFEDLRKEQDAEQIGEVKKYYEGDTRFAAGKRMPQ